MRAAILAAVLALVVLAGTVTAIVGLPSWVLLLAALVPWLVVVGIRAGIALAVSAVGIGALLLLLLLLMLTTATGLPMYGSVVVLWTALGLIGAFAVFRRRSLLRAPSRPGLATWLPSALGAVVWLGALGVSSVIPGASRLSWTMLGDSANNIIFAREIIYRGGIELGSASNPVPLPSALMALVMQSGRAGVPSAGLAEHDIAAFAQVWAIVIAMLCVIVGSTAALVARRAGARPLLLGVVSAGASLIPLSWFVTGYPLDYGFFNTHVAIVIVLASLVSYLADARRVAVAIAVQLAASTLLLSVWSPLVLIPALFALAIVVTRWHEVLLLRRGQLALFALAMLQVAAYGLLVAFPGLLAQSHFLSAAGGAFPFRRWFVVAFAVIAFALGIAIFRRVKDLLVIGVVALAVALAIGLGALLFVTRNSPDPWTYYPLKFAWLGVVVLLVLVVGLGAAFLARYFRPAWLRALGIVAIAALTIGFLHWAPTSNLGFRWIEPVPKLISGQFLGQGDEVADQIFSLADPEHANLLWKTHEKYEGSVNFWVMQLWSNSMTKNLELKRDAYGLYDANKTSSLCRIVTLMGGRVTVHTADTHLAAELDASCPTIAHGVHIVSAP